MVGKYATETLQADAAGIARAVHILRDGGLVAVPTETVYGLAARADSDEAVAKIYAAKGRPSFNPLIVHVATPDETRRYAHLSGEAEALIAKHWPGPLTIVLPRRDDAGLAEAVTAGLPSIALRMPAHPAIRALLEAARFPLAAPSANRSGYISPTTPGHVLATLDGRIDAVIDGGACAAGLESTIIAVRKNGELAVLRPGPIALGQAVSSGAIEAPGQLASHYAPGKPMRLDAAEVAPDEFLIGFGAVAGDANLSARGDLNEAAARLYVCLHLAASSAKPQIAVAPVPEQGVGAAINDRLRRAATLPHA
ncbi:L-threonylcarbamoyladenylate synthase [Qipengyuania marisflavi]|uniref:Threonylcarbamoyl-AMP synthase n=1 Tax=Qipengyuania marisflavi TaxID=2486356 RepID=A0A5S3P7H7_9SPHN|nr:L-threonylcarbamoyladenylate synthase [Qipengyuania marisflavi]TMM48183.1 threonylcarbamoyl-AMP synthase [Qipengyuania marisflavi]